MNKNDLVKQYITERIDNRTFTPGNIIDSSNMLKNELNVSLMTIRKAVQELVDEGLLYKEKGRGTFVSLPPKYNGFQCGTNFSAEITKLGMVPSTHDAKIEKIAASEDLAAIFNIEIGHPLWQVNRVRSANGKPVMDATEYFLYNQMPNLSEEVIYNSIYDYLEPKGIVFHHADQKIEACLATPHLASRLKINENDPLIKVTLTSMIQNGNIFSYSIEYFETSSFTLNQTIYAK